MSTISTTSHNRGMVYLNMADLQVLDIKTLSFTISLQIVDKNKEELASSFRPTALVTGSLDAVTLGMTTNTTIVTSKSNSLLVGNDIIKITLSLD